MIFLDDNQQGVLVFFSNRGACQVEKVRMPDIGIIGLQYAWGYGPVKAVSIGAEAFYLGLCNFAVQRVGVYPLGAAFSPLIFPPIFFSAVYLETNLKIRIGQFHSELVGSFIAVKGG